MLLAPARSDTYMSAARNCRAWNTEIGWPNCMPGLEVVDGQPEHAVHRADGLGAQRRGGDVEHRLARGRARRPARPGRCAGASSSRTSAPPRPSCMRYGRARARRHRRRGTARPCRPAVFAVTTSWSATSPPSTAIFAPETVQPSPALGRGGRDVGQRPARAGLGAGEGEQRLAAGDAGQDRLLLLGGAGRGDQRAAQHDGGDERLEHERAAERLHDDRQLADAHAGAAVLLVEGQARAGRARRTASTSRATSPARRARAAAGGCSRRSASRAGCPPRRRASSVRRSGRVPRRRPSQNFRIALAMIVRWTSLDPL